MKWYDYSVEYFEGLRDTEHYEFAIMRKHQGDGTYRYLNKLRALQPIVGSRRRGSAGRRKRKGNARKRRGPRRRWL